MRTQLPVRIQKESLNEYRSDHLNFSSSFIMIFFSECFSAFLSRNAIPTPLSNENMHIMEPTNIVYYDNGNILNIRNNYGSRCAFNINHVKNHWADIELFNEYFYTIKEYRKLKLEKIYEGR